ncbi:MAG: hypothetical protein GTO51_01020 [Candidatus Latescibacteria bacterium]|nr:hypothetical protein [Candidatus Latescibacterota bacterium]NIM21580.1 hypothetical protein [Candidatus Latescibacterota bacterium]NIM64559.1 hypothetical protein [Candidatus Latescibacterota bacterium]NIO01074.1 hypothetical protein [Candidatus Latescibacterota bacterium]NIO27467.1 hypothetical protein [Candidatus Latescibacterota bacterium]
MRRLNISGVGLARGVSFLIIVAAITSASITEVSGQAGTADTARVEETVKDEEGKQVRIRIDEEGISIEGGDVEIEEPEDVRAYRKKGTDIVKFGEDVYVARDEMIRGDLVVFGGDVTVEGIVGGNVVVIGGDIEVGSEAEIKGDAVVLGGNLEEEVGAVIHGERVMFKGFFPFKHVTFFPTFHSKVFPFVFFPVKFVLSLILSFLIILFIRERILRSERHLTTGVFKSFGIGFLIIFVGGITLLILSILLCITIIGIPLAFILVVSSIGILLFAWTIAAYALGEAVRKKLQVQSTNAFLIVFIGTTVLFLPGFIGYGLSVAPLFSPLGAFFKLIGFLITTFAELAGLGALFLSRFGGRELVAPAPVPAPAPETP